MKLLYCTECEDVFKLKVGETRQCDCGRVKGRYLDNIRAEVSATAVSLAIGNGALLNAIYDMTQLLEWSEGKAERNAYYEAGQGKIAYAWVRPNEGPGNPHCTVIMENQWHKNLR